MLVIALVLVWSRAASSEAVRALSCFNAIEVLIDRVLIANSAISLPMERVDV